MPESTGVRFSRVSASAWHQTGGDPAPRRSPRYRVFARVLTVAAAVVSWSPSPAVADEDLRIRIDSLSASPSPFSPAHGVMTFSGSVRISEERDHREGDEPDEGEGPLFLNWTFTVFQGGGTRPPPGSPTVVRMLSGRQPVSLPPSGPLTVPVTTTFDGRDQRGGQLADGSYSVFLSVQLVEVKKRGREKRRGSATSAPVGFVQDATPPLIRVASVTPPANPAGWHNTAVTVTFTCSDPTAGLASCTGPVTIGTEGAGQVVTGTAVDKAGNTASASVTSNIDRTPPAIDVARSPAANASGWNNTDVSLAYTCRDALSGVASCPAVVTVVDEGANQGVTRTATDVAGNTATVTATLNIDKTAPAIMLASSPAANAAGWNNTDVTVSATCSDALSGVETCPAALLVGSEGAAQVVSRTATDRAGNTASASLTLSIDKTPPVVIAARAPEANANGWNNTDVAVAFTCQDALSGVASCPVTTLVQGEGADQPVTGTATDVAGNTATATVTVSIDKTPPTIMLASTPGPNGAGWNNTDVAVEATCSDALSGVDICPTGQLVGTEGAAQAIGRTATDRAGNTASASVTLSIDKTPPVVSATPDPAPNADGWNNTPVTVHFACADALSGVATCPSDSTLAAEGLGQVVMGSATDVADNVADASVTLNIDRTPPDLSIASPADGAIVPEASVHVSGSADDALSGLVEVACNGTPALLAGTAYVCEVPLQAGANPIGVEARDRAGNAATRGISVTQRARLIVTITSPAPLTLFATPSATVTGTVDGPVVSVDVNGVAATVSGQSFTASVPLREGHTVLTATATDAGGNVGTGSVTVILDTTPPVIRIDAPTDGAVLTAGQVTVTGMINDIVSGTVNQEQATVTVNGVPATISNRSFVVADLLLTRGQNVITAVARDRAGNTSQTEMRVTFQDVAGQQRIEVVAGQNQSGVINSVLPQPLTVSVVDAFGRPLPGRPVTFSVVRTDGILHAFPDEGRSVTVITDDLGLASASFQLGSRTGAGNNQVAVTSPGFAGETMFCASSTVGPPADIKADAVMGEVFRGIAGAPLPTPFIAIVFDAGGNPVAGVPVTFTVRSGGGHLDGETVVTRTTDPDGKAAVRLTLGPEPGFGNNRVDAAFPNMGGAPIVFTSSAVAPGPPLQTRVSGVVLDNTDQPVPHALAKIVGTPLEAFTDDQGRFSISGAPVGTVTLIVDGSTSTRPEAFPFLAFMLTNIAGQDNTIGMPIFLPPLDTAGSRIVGGDQEVTLTMADVPGVAFTVAPHSTTFPNGARVGRLSISQVHADRVPMPPPYGTAPRIVWTLQPAGVHFNPPVRVQLPNTDALAPGQVIEVFQFDHDVEQFVSVGAARVSEDGSVIVSDPGFGITKSGWGGAPPPPPPCSPVCKGNECNDSVQQGCSCVFVPKNEGGACDDKNDCTTNDRCQSGTCKGDDDPKVTLSPDPIKLQYGKDVTVTASGSPAKGHQYTNWNLKSKTFENDVKFTAQPKCPEAASCDNTIESKEVTLPKPKTKVCGTATAEVTFECKAGGGKSVMDTAPLEVGCGGKSASECTAFCAEPRAQGMCGTACDMLGLGHPPYNAATGACWKVNIGGTDFCYWDHRAPGGPGFVNLCCPNRCFGGSFTVWGQGPGSYVCTVIERCADNPEFAGAECTPVS